MRDNPIQITLTEEQIEGVVRNDLVLAYKLIAKGEFDEAGIFLESNQKLLDALEVVVAYYSSHLDFQWFQGMKKVWTAAGGG